MSAKYETDTPVRTFDREVDRLKSAADSVRRANSGTAPSDRSAPLITAPATSTLVPVGLRESAWIATNFPDPATTISAALGGFDATGATPILQFISGADLGPERFRVCGAAADAGQELRALLTRSDQPMSSFVPDHGLRIGGRD